MGFWRVLGETLLVTLEKRSGELFSAFIQPAIAKRLPVRKPSSPWLTDKLWSEKTVDGGVIFGTDFKQGAKYALPKGLPRGNERFLAIRNPDHTANDFDGVIAGGYGKGVKRLLYSDTIPVKVKGSTSLRKVNIHFHEADVAGPHYDLVVEGLHADEFEIHIPRGEFKGRYSFIPTDKGTIVVPMLDRTVLYTKPDYHLKDESFLDQVDQENLAAVQTGKPAPWIVEHKLDGSLVNVHFHNGRAHMRSHRDTANAYYDKLPHLELLKSDSRFFTYRKLFSYPDLDGTIIKGELVHPDGVSRVAGILNSMPDKAQHAQQVNGNVEFYGWDIVQYKGKDISHLPYEERRAYLVQTIELLRPLQPEWKVCQHGSPGSGKDFYNILKRDERGLPYSEGVVVKRAGLSSGGWYKVKPRDYVDTVILPGGFIEGDGKYRGSLGAIVVRNESTGTIGQVGSGFSDFERQYIWDNREKLSGAVVKVSVMEETDTSLRAPVFEGFAPDARNPNAATEMGLMMYADSLAGSEGSEAATEMKYKLINSR